MINIHYFNFIRYVLVKTFNCSYEKTSRDIAALVTVKLRGR